MEQPQTNQKEEEEEEEEKGAEAGRRQKVPQAGNSEPKQKQQPINAPSICVGRGEGGKEGRQAGGWVFLKTLLPILSC